MSSSKPGNALGKGIAWIGGVRWTAQIVSWFSTLFVVRLLHPEDYGVVGMATTYVQMAQMLTEFGVGTAVLALKDMGTEEVAQANTLTLLFGLVGVIISLMVAIPIGHFFNEPRVVGVVWALSPLCLTGALAAVPSAVLMRELRYKESAFVDLARSLFSSVFVLILAIAGAGYWALIGGQLIGAVIPLGILLIWYSQPFRRITKAGITPLLEFSKEIIIGRFAWMAYQSSHIAIVGRVLGTALLGQYTFAWTIATMPGEKLATVVGSVLPSALGSVRDDAAAQWRYLRNSLEALSIIMVPALLGIIATAPDFIQLAFGNRWLGAVVPLRLLALYAILQWFLPLLYPVLLIAGDVKFQRKIGLLHTSFLIPAFYIGTRWGGLTGICVAWLLSWPITGIPTIKLAMKRLGRRPIDLWQAMSVGVVGALLSSGIVIVVREITHRLGYGSLAALLIGVPLSILGHSVLVLYIRPGIRARLHSLLSLRLRNRTKAVAD